MSFILNNFLKIKSDILKFSSKTNLIVVCKNQSIDVIRPIIDEGHLHFGENKVQEAKKKWQLLIQQKNDLKLHMIGRLQVNKAKDAVALFDYIHSLDSIRLANALSLHEMRLKKQCKYFIQINFENETQKGGVLEKDLHDLYSSSQALNLNVIGLMCIPPKDQDAKYYFEKLENLGKKFDLTLHSIGMSGDYIKALECNSSFVRIGSAIFSN